MERKKVIIIGSGPAGHTAALYTARADLNPLIVEGVQPGGQLTTTTDVENFPGFPEGIMGPELMEKMKQQAARFGANYLTTEVSEVTLTNRPFNVICENGDRFEADSLIISTGASAKYLGLPHEQELIGRGVSACATCDGFFYRDRIVHVVGGGDTAMEEATFLTKFASQVTVIHRRDTLRASRPMQQRAFDNPKINFIWDSSVNEILHNDQGVIGIKVENLKTGEISERATDGLFMGIGHSPNTAFLNGQLPMNQQGYIITHQGTPRTDVAGVYACGDVQDHVYRQAITAAGSGCMAAIEAERFLEEAT